MNYYCIEFFIKKCKKIFLYKLKDYGLSWKFLKSSSIIDQIFIKIIRVKNISFKGFYFVKKEGILDTYIDITNYLLIALIKLELDVTHMNKISNYDIIYIYEKNIKKALNIINKMNYCNNSNINIFLKKILYLKKSLNKLSNNQIKKIYFKVLIDAIFLVQKIINNS